MKSHGYVSIVQTSEKVAWTIEGVIANRTFDFSKNFLPEALAYVQGFSFLGDVEKLKLNQIRGHSYLQLFSFFEEVVLPAVQGLVRDDIHGSKDRVRGLTRFMDEEVKHQLLFKRLAELFAVGFGSPCEWVDGPEKVSDAVNQKSKLAVMLLIAAFEWGTQRHFVEAVQEKASELDPLFVDALRAHWVEEAQHTKINDLEIAMMGRALAPEQVESALDELLELGGAVDGILAAQCRLDICSLGHAVDRVFTQSQTDELQSVMHKAYSGAFLGSGLTHPSYQKMLGALSPTGQARFNSALAAAS